jgi:hypothetical protein
VDASIGPSDRRACEAAGVRARPRGPYRDARGPRRILRPAGLIHPSDRANYGSMISKASTSIMPRSEILRCGITGSGRKASCRKGSSSVPPSAFAAFLQRDQLLAHMFIGLVAHQAGHRQRDFGNHVAVLGDDEAAADFAQPVGGCGHIGFCRADNADIVAVMADGRGNGAPFEAEALNEAGGNVAVLAVTLDHRDLEDVAGRIDLLSRHCRW